MKSIITLALLLLLTGCGIRTEVVRVNVPDIRVNPEQGPVVVVAPVRDSRPVYFPEVAAADRAKNIAGVVRQGNGVLVSVESTTAAEKTREIMIQALRNMGYRTADRCEASCTLLETSLTDFSVKMPANFFRMVSSTQQMLADISVQVVARRDGQTRTFTATGHGANIFQVPSRENWEIALERAVKSFSSSLQQSMSEQDTAAQPQAQD
ncbi:hypothetical protein [Stenotrophomonas indicatrix]|uniref:hypothetical protein n=1 Tax=Stenotrophomonas indicatrix TaxID=2045451 RepID=UPI0008AE2426|nr:hypothetical protein [Stenotrophomonas indicatrix]SEU08466.1 hypothetical protein SAMN05720615_1148 [Stenotrophomonas indicatrix]